MSNTAGTEVPEEFVRPAPPAGLPGPGRHWAAKEEDPREWATALPGKTCRWRGSGAGHACGEPAVLQKLRGVRRRIWWFYCARHSYGRWIEGGKVMVWAPEPDAEAPK